LHEARDAGKDQSYFLHSLLPAQLEAALFPLGELLKQEVRERARRAGLPVHDKPDGTGICFIGERPFREFLGQYIADRPEKAGGDTRRVNASAPIMDSPSTRWDSGGSHWSRRSCRPRRGAMRYVARKDLARNALIVVQGHDRPLLLAHRVTTGVGALARADAAVPVRGDRETALSVKPMRRVHITQGEMADCTSSAGDPQRAVTPGQFAVLYDGVALPRRCRRSSPPTHRASPDAIIRPHFSGDIPVFFDRGFP
jgi:tRNA-specific 2-thiouridylase